MAIVEQKWNGSEVSFGDDGRAEIRSEYVVRGTTDEFVAEAALEAATLDAVGGLTKTRVAITGRLAESAWEGEVVWSPATYRQPEQNIVEADGFSFSFDTGGGTEHVTHSLATTAYAPPGMTPPDNQGAIGVTKDSVEGVDVTVPTYQFSETYHLDSAVVTPAYKVTLFGLTGVVNSQPFKGFAAGEVLFLGAAGSKRNTEKWEVNFRFAASANAVNLVVGTITGIAKRGWEYLWVRYREEEDTAAHALVMTPVAVYVEQVYFEADLNALGI